MKRNKKNFLYGAMVLTAGMAVVKVIGALFKVPLKYAVGEYGMGLFNVAYHFYGPIFSLATAGFPVAVARLVSENRSLGRWEEAERVKRVAMPIFLAFGAVGMALITALAPLYCERVIVNGNALYPMLALAPAILFACGASVYRGYFEGMQDMGPTAVSQVLEALVKLGVGLTAAFGAVSRGTEEYAAFGTVFGIAPASADEASFLILAFGAAGAILGVTAGSLVSLVYLALRFRRGRRKGGRKAGRGDFCPKDRRGTAKRLIRIAAPVAVGAITVNIAGLIDTTFLQNRLTDIMGKAPGRLLAALDGEIPTVYLANPETIPTFLYGCYTLALTIYLLVPSMTQAFGISALPTVTEAWARGDRKELGERIRSVICVAALFCFPAGLGLSALAEPVARLLYGDGEAIPIVASSLELLGVASLAAAMCVPLSSVLQAMGRADLPVKLLFGAMAVKVGVNWVLCGVPEIHILGAGIGTLLCYLFLAVSQLFFLGRVAGTRLGLSRLLMKPLLCAVLCGISAKAAHMGLGRLLPNDGVGETASMGGAIFLAACVYAAGLLILCGIRKKELLLLPGGQKITKMLEKRKWI